MTFEQPWPRIWNILARCKSVGGGGEGTMEVADFSLIWSLTDHTRHPLPPPLSLGDVGLLSAGYPTPAMLNQAGKEKLQSITESENDVFTRYGLSLLTVIAQTLTVHNDPPRFQTEWIFWRQTPSGGDHVPREHVQSGAAQHSWQVPANAL